MRSLAKLAKNYLNYVLLRNPAGRLLTVLPNDIFLVTYPRSGSTWSRFLFGNLIHTNQPVNFINMDRLVPMIGDHPDRVLRSLPRILKSHECFDPRYPRVIHIVRDPRDVAVSFYYHNLKVRVLPDFPDDVFIVSHPKSGNTWTRFLIGNLIFEEGVDFSNINERIPDPVGLAKRYLKRLPRPRYIKSHEPYDPRYQKIIFIVRDPRDVVLSEYHFDVKRRAIEEGFPIEPFVKRFLDGKVNHEFGSWRANVGSWMVARENTRDFLNGRAFLLLRYEDMMADAKRELGRVALFLGINPAPERIANAVERSSADHMRKMEQSQAHLWSSKKDTRKAKPFVRAATAGSWRQSCRWLPFLRLSPLGWTDERVGVWDWSAWNTATAHAANGIFPSLGFP